MIEFIGCSWCQIRTQGCRCVTPCGAPHCDAEWQKMPGLIDPDEQELTTP